MNSLQARNERDDWFSHSSYLSAYSASSPPFEFPESTEERSRSTSSAAMFESFNLGIYPILIVDDNEGVCILIARMLSNLGFKSIYLANSAKQAYSIFATQLAEEAQDPIIFLDLRLPDVPGEKVAKKIIEVRPTSKIILITAEDSTAEGAKEAMRQGAAAYIQKPIGLAKIRAVLLSVLQDMENSNSNNKKSEDQQ
jgi:DNA-binding NtrC family response regulator